MPPTSATISLDPREQRQGGSGLCHVPNVELGRLQTWGERRRVGESRSLNRPFVCWAWTIRVAAVTVDAVSGAGQTICRVNAFSPDQTMPAGRQRSGGRPRLSRPKQINVGGPPHRELAHNMAGHDGVEIQAGTRAPGSIPVPERQGSLRIDLPGERGCRVTNWELTSTYLRRGRGESFLWPEGA